MTAGSRADRPRVAVIIPCHQCAAYVGEAVQSALDQDYGPLDVIAVDDGSPDNVREALEPFLDRIRLLAHERNLGASAARNTGLDATDAPLVAFLDADDRWHSSKVRRQVEYLTRHADCGLVYVGRRVMGGDDEGTASARSRTEPLSGRCWHALLSRCNILTSQVMVRRETLGDLRFAPDTCPVEDWDLWLRLAERTSFGWIDDPLVERRIHDRNISKNHAAVVAGVVRMLTRAAARLEPGSLRAAVHDHLETIRTQYA